MHESEDQNLILFNAVNDTEWKAVQDMPAKRWRYWCPSFGKANDSFYCGVELVKKTIAQPFESSVVECDGLFNFSFDLPSEGVFQRSRLARSRETTASPDTVSPSPAKMA